MLKFMNIDLDTFLLFLNFFLFSLILEFISLIILF